MCIEALESITNSLSSGNFEVGAGVATLMMFTFLSDPSGRTLAFPNSFYGASALGEFDGVI